MPFTSAELKTLYETLHNEGIPVSASEAARLFRAGQLREMTTELVYFAAEARRITDKIERIELAIETLRIQSYGRTQAENELMAQRTEALEWIALIEDQIEELQVIADTLPHLLVYQEWLTESVLWLNDVIANADLTPAGLAGLLERREQYWQWQKDGLENIEAAQAAVAQLEDAEYALDRWNTTLVQLNYDIGSLGIEAIEALNELEVLEEQLELEQEYLGIMQDLTRDAMDRWLR